jgi:indolepyruvate ferredoxin oxidoreductase beta subunit
MSSRRNKEERTITLSINTVNIAITGVGGQGVLTLADLLAQTVLVESLNVRVGEIHGMAQRGGHVVCTVRVGPGAVGPIIDTGDADLLVGFEPVETLRELNLLKPSGSIVMNSHIIHPVAVSMGQARYPTEGVIRSSIRKFTHNLMELDATRLAESAGSSISVNIVMMGAVIATGLLPVSQKSAIDVMLSAFSSKFADINKEAFRLGFEEVKRLKSAQRAR